MIADVSSKENYHLSKFIGIRTKLRQAIGALVIARESPIAVFGCDEMRDWFHAQVYAGLSYRGYKGN